ncbi:hsp90 co-chaperone Cdc37 [Coelomomyces lativittatus]|nr:hsp90 co-chaperone Cdc37 [Coelomomyces lativittatus]
MKQISTLLHPNGMKQEREDRRQGIISTRAQLEWLDEYMDLLKHYPSPTQEIETTVQAHLKKFENIPKEILIQNVHEKTPEAFDSFRKTVIEHRASVQKEHDRLVTEENEKLTVDNICKPGFDSKTRINPTSLSTAPPNKPSKSTQNSSKSKTKEEVLEVLNPAGVEAGKEKRAKEEAAKLRKPEDQFIESDAALVFANLPSNNYDSTYSYLKDYPYLVNQEYSDMILASAFRLQMNHHTKKMKNYVHQALVLQFTSNLGVEGVPLFFARIKDQNHRVTQMFNDDLQRTTQHIIQRCEVLQAKAKGELQSVVDLTPNPAKLELLRDLPQSLQQAILTEDMQKIELSLSDKSEYEKERMLDKLKAVGILRPPGDVQVLTEDEKLELFKQLPEDFSEALINGHLDKVNELLASYSEEEADRILDICKRGDFLEVSERDEEGAPTANSVV